MKKFLLFAIVFLTSPRFSFGQNFTFESDTLTRTGAPGQLIILDANIRNISQQELHLRVIRVQNVLPSGWSTSLCSGELCYPPDVDLYTIPDPSAGVPPLGVGQTAQFHLNFNTDAKTPGNASVPIRVENINNPSEFSELTFTASTSSTGLHESDLPLTSTYRLHANYPNPFNPSTKIPFEIGGVGAIKVQLQVYNLLGEKIATLLDDLLSPGIYEIEWEARDQSGNVVPSGFYFYEIYAGTFKKMRKMLLLR